MNKQIDELMALWRQIAEVLLKDPHNDKIRIAFISALESALGQSQAVPASALKPCELIGWEWRWYDANPNTVTHGQWSEWKRVEPRNLLQTVDDAVNEFRAYIANGQRYELRALYTAAPPAQTPMQMSTPDERGYAIFTATPPPRLPNGWLDEEGIGRLDARLVETAVRKQFGYD